jgi:hypothetical protein
MSERAVKKERQIIGDFLEKNGWSTLADAGEYASYCREDGYGIDVSDEDIVFIDDTGDFYTMPLNYYALVGFIYIHRLIPIIAVSEEG